VARYARGAQHPQSGTILDPKLDKGDFVFLAQAKPAGSPPAGQGAAEEHAGEKGSVSPGRRDDGSATTWILPAALGAGTAGLLVILWLAWRPLRARRRVQGLTAAAPSPAASAGETAPAGVGAAPQAPGGMHTGGGGVVFGNIHAHNVAARDQVIHQREPSVSIGGSVSGSNIVTGDRNVVGARSDVSREEFLALLEQIRVLVAAGLEAGATREVEVELRAAQEEARAARPDGRVIGTRLGRVAELVKPAGDLAEGTSQLFSLARKAVQWAVTLFP
jgi:hypothetical protein